jgi:phosphoglycerate kinase
MDDKVDEMIITGGMPLTFLKVSEGVPIGNSLFDDESAAIVPEMLEAAKAKSVRIQLVNNVVCQDWFEPNCDVRTITKATGG